MNKHLPHPIPSLTIALICLLMFSCKDPEPIPPTPEPTTDPGEAVSNPNGRVFYLDAVLGKDANNGSAPDRAWKTLGRASKRYEPGDWILLRAGQTFEGQLELSGQSGEAGKPIKIGTYDTENEEDRAKIDCSFYSSAIELSSCSHIELENLEITGDGGGTKPDRRGVHCSRWGNTGASESLHFNNLYVHDLFAPASKNSDGKRPTMHEGTAFQFSSPNAESAHFRDIRIENCRVENVSTHGIILHKWPDEGQVSAATFHEDIVIVDNQFRKLGGDGIVTAGCKNVYIARNLIEEPGCFDDTRMKGRGDGLWTWYTYNAIAEYNQFTGAKGRLDCAGMHVDIGSRDNIFQYNLSMDNEGGFCEIIGNAYNNVYRYNVSINDGGREEGQNEYGQYKGPSVVIMLSGYMADRLGADVKEGPYHSYIYNNTIYTKASIDANFTVDHSARGALIANNLFIIDGEVRNVSWRGPSHIGEQENIIFENNRTVIGKAIIPHDTLSAYPLWNQYLNNLAIDPQLANEGGINALDYLPGNHADIQDQGIDLYLLPGDANGVSGGFVPAGGDYRGTSIAGLPDIGAFEIQ